MAFPWLQAAGLATGLFDSIFGTTSQNNINQQQLDWAKESFAKQREYALSDWDRMNNYNAPKAQMQRLKDAGLNPNLVYGGGAVGNSAQGVRSSEPRQPNLQAPETHLQNAVLQFADLSKTIVQTDNLKAQADLIKSQTKLNNANTQLKTDSLDYNLEYLQQRNRNMFKNEMLQDQSLGLRASANRRADEANVRDAARLQIQQAQLRNNTISVGTQAKLAAEKILNMRAEREKTAIGRTLIAQQIENLKKDGKLKDYEARLNSAGLTKGDNALYKLMENAIDVFLNQ